MTAPAPAATPSPKAFHHLSFRLYWFAIMASSFSAQIVSVSVGWQIYDLTRDPLYLGFVGLAQFLPALLLVLVTGIAADTFPRRVIMALCLGAEVVGAGALFLMLAIGRQEVWPIFVVLVTIGVSRAFLKPASSSLLPNILPSEALADAIGVNSSAWQLANIAGPVAGGLLYGISGAVAYGSAALLAALAMILVVAIPKPARHSATQAKSLDTLLAGFRYILKEKVVLGAISLDLFAVLLGGATALLPVYARDILQVGPWGLGMLRAAPGIGAIAMAIILSRFPVRDRAGHVLFVFVALFGLFTVVFGYSTSVWVAVPALIIMGGSDMVSVVIRETLLQLWTPDEVRGRVSAVNSVFIGASNELGEFRAGIVAAKWGTVFAVVVGGFGTMAVAGLWSAVFPGLRKQRGLDRRMV